MEESDFNFVVKALSIIKDCEGFKGNIECPKCHRDLYWTRSSFNKHIWGKCRTEDCIEWMQ